MLAPPAIIAINQDVSASAIKMLQRQLQIDFTFTASDWRTSLAAEDNYDQLIKSLGLRALVLEDSFETRGTNPLWTRYDIVAFVKNGLVNVEQNRLGPPIPQISIENLTWGKLGKFI